MADGVVVVTGDGGDDDGAPDSSSFEEGRAVGQAEAEAAEAREEAGEAQETAEEALRVAELAWEWAMDAGLQSAEMVEAIVAERVPQLVAEAISVHVDEGHPGSEEPPPAEDPPADDTPPDDEPDGAGERKSLGERLLGDREL